MSNPTVIHPHDRPDDLAILMPTSGYTVQYVDGERGEVTHLDRVAPESLARTGRRELRLMETLLKEALANVQDAWLIKEGGQ
ncbi:hypothetical protein SD37_11615 [Amycolatopsis orientalis]|uniref:Uncharacterized protein n=1 Tax=Amycolatopsis orientalis TaxID=31958 RepID=A0A193BVM0_AMYOR|nr:hypothetical protein [Amycolatopsis orientalis]ANN16225.1 hypothetical protein SD37_11615 [Amycolatopsis orientalis]